MHKNSLAHPPDLAIKSLGGEETFRYLGGDRYEHVCAPLNDHRMAYGILSFPEDSVTDDEDLYQN